MKLTWKHNPRVWLRDWLNKPTREEKAANEAYIKHVKEVLEQANHGPLAL